MELLVLLAAKLYETISRNSPPPDDYSLRNGHSHHLSRFLNPFMISPRTFDIYMGLFDGSQAR